MHINQDASENGRLELDPLGNNVGLEDWWYQNSQGTPDPTSGGDFPGFTSITNGQLIRYTVDGIQVPADYFGRMTDFAFGNSFGLIERQARLSAMPSGYKRDVFALVRQSPNSAPVFRPPGSPASNLPTLSDGETEIYGYLTVTRPVYNHNWAINMSLLPRTRRTTEIFASDAPDRKQLSFLDVTVLKKKVIELLTDKCKDFIKRLIEKTEEVSNTTWNDADAKTRRTLFAPRTAPHYTDVIGMFDAVLGQGGFYGSVIANISTMGGFIENKNATVYLARFTGWTTTMNTPDSGMTKAQLVKAYDYHMTFQALIAIHELIHFNYHDISLANAVAALNNDTKSRFLMKNTDAASLYWHAELKKHCEQPYSFNRR